MSICNSCIIGSSVSHLSVFIEVHTLANQSKAINQSIVQLILCYKHNIEQTYLLYATFRNLQLGRSFVYSTSVVVFPVPIFKLNK